MNEWNSILTIVTPKSPEIVEETNGRTSIELANGSRYENTDL